MFHQITPKRQKEAAARERAREDLQIITIQGTSAAIALGEATARAIQYEARRQIELIEEGKRVIQETRRWDENKDATFAMRSKENAQDYRYFPEPE